MKKLIVFTLVLVSSFINSYGQVARDSSTSDWQIRTEYARAYFGDEEMWGDASFISGSYNFHSQWSAQVALGFTQGSSYTDDGTTASLEQHAGKEIDLNVLVDVYTTNRFTLKAGIGGLYRRWDVVAVGGDKLSNVFNDPDKRIVNGSATYRQLTYVDGQLVLDGSYDLTGRLGASFNYAFQGNYMTYYKFGLYVKL